MKNLIDDNKIVCVELATINTRSQLNKLTISNVGLGTNIK